MKVFVLYEHDYENSGIVATYSTRGLAEAAMTSTLEAAEKRIAEEKARIGYGYGEPPCLEVIEEEVLTYLGQPKIQGKSPAQKTSEIQKI